MNSVLFLWVYGLYACDVINQGWYPLPTYPPTHWVLLGGWVVKKTHKNPLLSKIMTHFFKKISTVLLKPSWVEKNCQRKPRSGGSGMVQGWSQVYQTSFSQILSAPSPNKIFKSLCLFSVCQLQGFFDRYLAVKSYLRVLKFFVEFINVSS